MLEFDHILYAGPDLEDLRADFERRSGLQAAQGGRHANWGTHNALVGLGAGLYLELVAPEPGSSGPWADAFAPLPGPSLQAWCVRAGPASEVVARLARAGVGSRWVEGSRALPGGGVLTWELVFPVGHEFGGALPFFIDWGRSTHPSAALGAPAKLSHFTVEHPDAGELVRILAAVGDLPEGLEVQAAPGVFLAAVFATSARTFELEGELDPHTYLGQA